MMMGKKNEQLSFTSLEILSSWAGLPVVPENSIYAFLGRDQEIFRDELFADAYAKVGHPSKSPGLLAKVLLLQFLDGASDREAEERARYDLRWKAALGVGLAESGFDATTLSKFRTRLLLFQKERAVFERILEKAAEKRLLSREQVLQILDSTFIKGAAAVQNTYMLIHGAIRKLLNSLRARPQVDLRLGAGLKLDYRERKKPAIDWQSRQAREALLNDLVSDAMLVLEATAQLPLTETEQKLRAVLERVTFQDIEPKADGSGFQIKQGVAEDRIISTVDTDMRHGRKSAARTFNGYKQHLAMDQKSEFITAVEVTAGNVYDGEVTTELIDQQPAERKPSYIMGDCSYGTGEVRKDMDKRQIGVKAPVPEAVVPGGHLKKTDFVIDLDARTCRCPAGHYAVKTQRDRKTRELKAFYFAKEQCQPCPLRQKCYSGKRDHRTVRIHPYERYLQQGRKQQQTAEFQAEYRQCRPAIERKIAETVRCGGRQARYFGLAKVSLQMLFVTAAVNYKHYVKMLCAGVQAAAKALSPEQGLSVAC
jgi:transposase